jgi:hypothetical protein
MQIPRATASRGTYKIKFVFILDSKANFTAALIVHLSASRRFAFPVALISTFQH